MSMDEASAWYRMSRIEGFGKKTAEGLLEYFGGLAEALSAPAGELARAPRVSENMAWKLAELDLSGARTELERLRANGVELVHWRQAEYPFNLRYAPDGPLALYVRGSLLKTDEYSAAIVGATYPSARSVTFARQLAGRLAELGLCIVSGLARGIDTAAHLGALEAGARTLAVLGSGIDRVFPPENRTLAEEVVTRGALVSELPPGTPVSGRRLMARNRITSGLVRAVIVVESLEDSGSVQTAEFAWRQGRIVLAVQGGNSGNEALIARGATPIRDLSETGAIAEMIRQFQPGPADKKQQMKLDFD